LHPDMAIWHHPDAVGWNIIWFFHIFCLWRCNQSRAPDRLTGYLAFKKSLGDLAIVRMWATGNSYPSSLLSKR